MDAISIFITIIFVLAIASFFMGTYSVRTDAVGSSRTNVIADDADYSFQEHLHPNIIQ
jgi:hypothetical protein